jgi:hypothetical protein
MPTGIRHFYYLCTAASRNAGEYFFMRAKHIIGYFPGQFRNKKSLGPLKKPPKRVDYLFCQQVFWIRNDFNKDADSDPVFFYLNADTEIQGAKPMRIHADPDPGQTLPSQKV